MKSLQKFLPKYSIALAVVFVATVVFLITKGNSVDIEAGGGSIHCCYPIVCDPFHPPSEA